MILHKIADKCKSKEFMAFLLVFGTGLLAFGLGRMSAMEETGALFPLIQGTGSKNIGRTIAVPNRTDVFSQDVVRTDAAGMLAAPVLADGGLIVASKNGTKYHFPWCAGGRAISETNRIWFKSAEAARLAGYAPASNCKGLK